MLSLEHVLLHCLDFIQVGDKYVHADRLHLWFSERNQCLLTGCIGLGFHNIYTSIFLHCGVVEIWLFYSSFFVCFFVCYDEVFAIDSEFRPDLTYEVEWALTASYLLTYFLFNSKSRFHEKSQMRVYIPSVLFEFHLLYFKIRACIFDQFHFNFILKKKKKKLVL